MNIKTKFDIGDKVWLIRESVKYKKCDSCGIELKVDKLVWEIDDSFIICGISANWRKEKNTNAQHWTEYRASHGTSLPKDDMFPTKKQAQAECDKRNKKGES